MAQSLPRRARRVRDPTESRSEFLRYDLQMAHSTDQNPRLDAISLRLGDRGRLVLPAAVRRRLQLHAGERLILVVQRTGIRIVTARQAVHQTRGIYRRLAPERSLAKELIAERRGEVARERV